jgi:Ca-activated chloride channel family protein
LQAAKAAAQEFVEDQPPTVRIGVVAFGGTGLVVQPPTDDQAAILASIERLSPQGGTSLGQGIFTSLNAIAGRALSIEEVSAEETGAALRLEEYSSAVVILLTDGENTDVPDPLEIAQVAAEAGVRVYAIGVGSQEGTIIQLQGFSILTRLDETRLEQIAEITNGKYFRAEDQEALSEVYENIDLQLTTRGEEMEVTSLAAATSLLLLLLGGGLSLSWFGRVP